MAPFTPIFAYVFFGILWLFQVIFTLLVLTIPASEVLSVIEDILLILWLVFRIGPSKTFAKFSNFKKNKSFIKRFGVQAIADLIPVVNLFPWTLWFIYKQHKDEVKEYRNKELGIVEEESENKGPSLLKKLALSAAVISTGGAAATVAGESAVASEVAGAEVAETAGATAESRSIGSIERNTGNELTQSPRRNGKQIDKKTIEEEVGGVKTGLNREDYDAEIKNYGDFNTYTKDNKEKEEQKVRQEEEKKKNDKAKRIQGLKIEKDLREEILDRSKRRFGESSGDVKRLEGDQDERGEGEYRDEYRESA